MRALSLLTCLDDPRLTLNIHFAVMGFFLGERTIHFFHESRALNGYLEGGLLYLIQVINNTVYYLIF
jgi:hypothetical protein